MTPDDVLLARAIRALRDAVVLCGAGCLMLAVVAGGVIALAGPDATLGPTALTILGGGQLIALVGAVVAALGLRAALAGSGTAAEAGPAAGAGTEAGLATAPGTGAAVATAGRAVSTVRTRLRWLVRVVLVWCVGTAAGWSLAVPSRVVVTLALAAVAAQLAVLLLVAVRRLEQASLEG